MKTKFASSSRRPSGRPSGASKPSARTSGGPRQPQQQREPRASKGGGPAWPRDWRAVIGTHAILEVFKARPKSICQVWFKQGWESTPELKEMAQEFRTRGLKVESVPVAFLDKVSPSHQGAAIFSNETPELNWSLLESVENSTVLVLDGIEDPQNLGAILRTAWLMGVHGAMIPEDRSVGLTATVHKVACGGVEHVPVDRVTNFSNPLETLKKDGFWIFGLSHEGERSLFDLQIPEKVVWCIGSEEKGLRVTTERMCDELVRIPQISAAASYNASVATAIALTETYRQRTHRKL